MRWPDAPCLGHVDLFFPEDCGRGAPRRRLQKEQAAQLICSACPYAAACLTAALENDERYGIWGGTTPQQRAQMLSRRDRRYKQQR